MYACLWKFLACIQIKGLLHLLNFNMNTVSGYLSCGKDRTKQRASKQLITLMVYYWQPMRSVYTEEHHRVWYKIWISNKLYALRSRSKLFIILEKKKLHPLSQCFISPTKKSLIFQITAKQVGAVWSILQSQNHHGNEATTGCWYTCKEKIKRGKNMKKNSAISNYQPLPGVQKALKKSLLLLV